MNDDVHSFLDHPGWDEAGSWAPCGADWVNAATKRMVRG